MNKDLKRAKEFLRTSGAHYVHGVGWIIDDVYLGPNAIVAADELVMIDDREEHLDALAAG